jgi:hypothetical protein
MRHVARILIVGGGCRGRRFAELMVAQGHAVRATTRSEARRSAVEATGAECWVGTPTRLATLRGALENVTIACWMLARASGGEEELAALHSSRLEFFLGQAIDTTVRGLVYDATPGDALAHPSREMLAEGMRVFRALTALNSIPAVVIDESDGRVEPGHGGRSDAGGPDDGRALAAWEERAWLADAQRAVASLLGGSR